MRAQLNHRTEGKSGKVAKHGMASTSSIIHHQSIDKQLTILKIAFLLLKKKIISILPHLIQISLLLIASDLL